MEMRQKTLLVCLISTKLQNYNMQNTQLAVANSAKNGQYGELDSDVLTFKKNIV